MGQFRDYPIPTLIWNGCEAKYNHTFDEVSTIYRNLSNTFSGIVSVADYYSDPSEYLIVVSMANS